MNPHLQVILNTIQQDKNLTAEQRAAIIQALQDADKEWEITAFKLDRTEKIKKTTAILLEETIEELEQKRKAVEAQNRELEIEAALERVRSRSMAMHKTDELLDAAELVSKELSALGIESMNVSYAFVDEEEKYASYYSLNPVDGKIPPFPFVFPHTETDVMRSILSSWKKQEPFHVIELDEEATLKHQTWVGDQIQRLITKNDIDIPFSVESFLSISPKKAVIYTFNFKQGYLFNIGGERLTREQEAMLMRFTNVFEMTYRRFLDLKQAEAQSREAQIELALERVRARTMAMQKSNELQQVVHTVFERLKELNVDFYTSIIILFTEGSKDIVWWFENRENQQYAQILIPYANINYLRDLFEAKDAGGGFFSKYYPFEEKNELFHYLFNNTVLQNVPEQQKKFLLETESATMSVAIATNTGIHLTSYSRKAFSEQENEILKRFAKVFDQAYTRFLDLQKAEAQAREAQIELGLERVRARAMAMQKSDELKELIGTVFTELTKLDLVLTRCVIMIYNSEANDSKWWMANSEDPNNPAGFFIKQHDHPPIAAYFKAWRERQLKWIYALEGQIKKDWDVFLFNETELRTLPGFVIEGMKAPDLVYLNASFNNFGNLTLASLEPLSEEHFDILLRFAKVFDLTYTRFNDLKQAEAQAREAQIQLALERVRARTMAMQKSEELLETSFVLFQQLRGLGEDSDQTNIGIFDEDDFSMTLYATTHGSQWTRGAKIELTKHRVYQQMYSAWKNNLKSIVIDIGGKELEALNKFKLENPDYQVSSADDLPKDRWIVHNAFFSKGTIAICTTTPRPDESIQLFERFAQVFDHTYTRFLDLQKAEAQAKEAQIEAALERIRNRTLLMKESKELSEAAVILFQQFEALGLLPPHARTYFNVINENDLTAEVWMTEADGSMRPGSFKMPLTTSQALKNLFAAWKRKEPVHIRDLSGDSLNEYIDVLRNIPSLQEDKSYQQLFVSRPERRVISEAIFLQGTIGIISDQHVSRETLDTLVRFAKAFEFIYTRFLDLQKAEAQARAAKIEAALERVRAKAMAMQNSDELGDLVTMLFDELTKLDMVLARCIIWVFNNNDFSSRIWMANSEDKKSANSYFIKALQHPYYEAIIQGWQQRVQKWVYVLEGSEKKSIDDLLLNETELAGLPDPVKNGIRSSEHTIVSGSFNNFGLIEASGPLALSDEQMEILSRFAKVFDLSYTRFNDLQQAEAQAREARIEAALERVRSKTMAMHNSQDVTSATETMFEELKKLGIDNLRCGIANIHPNKTFDVFGVTNLEGGNKMSGFGLFGMDEHPVWQRWFESWKNKEEVFIAFLTGQEKEEYFNNINNHRNYLPQKIVQFPDNYFQAYYFEQGSVWAYSLSQHSEPEKEIMKRFATGFSLTFRRYQDLKQSEARAREAKIEAALERVRARAMAMHKSDDLEMAVATVFEELDKLNLGLIRCGIAILDKEKPRGDIWITIKSEQGNTLQVSGDEPLDIHPLLQGAYDAWKKREDFSYVLKEQDLAKYYQAITTTNFQQPISTSFHAEKTGEQQYYFNAVFQDGSLFAFLNAGFTDEAKMVMKRFANVFDLTYKRFLDLQKAEAQAREAKIEAALERVRANAMAMHNSKDLAATIGVFYRELQTFSITPRRCGVGLLNKENRTAELSTMNTTEQGDSVEIIGTLKMQGHPVLEAVYDNWLQQKEYHPVLRGNEIKEYYGLLRPQIEFPDYPNDAVQYGYFFFFSEGGVYAWTEKELSEDELQIYRRFTTVLSLTYKRYIDLKQAEANAKEAIKQAALDRIRADIASMRTVSDLDRITPLVWNELTILGIPFIRCGVFIMDEPQQLIHTFLSTPDGKAIAAFHLPYDTPGNIGHVLWHWRNNQNYIDHWNESSFKELAGILVQQKAIDFPEQYLHTIPTGGFFLHFLPFLQGMLYVGNTTQLEEEQINLIQSVADAFSTAYARYEDFTKLEAAKQQVEKTLADLKQAQTQLVQSEKMASLGELTAGIAHEIQNPLNFVNNFSDVSNELLGEMKTELEKGNIADAIAIAEDVKQNLEKILHHGKRADGIVKGMLQHSRTSSGQKELTNINTLADEYMRLAYHGLRAKDKTFNAKFETDFDSSLEKINVIPQDMGRVILNLINNAFYAVSEKKKQNLDGYQPTVTLTTKKSGDRVLIIVRDNGNGITPKMLEKIFQPFFTTKPTGQGTGLGLSLSYDIVKAHGGELTVNTKEGEATEFVICLPLTEPGENSGAG